MSEALAEPTPHRHNLRVHTDVGPVDLPTGIDSLDAFCGWATSPAAEALLAVRAAWIDGRMEVELGGSDPVTHGTPKAEIAAAIVRRLDELEIGRAFTGGALFAVGPADLAVAPDVCVLAAESVREGRVRIRASRSGGIAMFEGPPDLAVEIVSPSDPAKDTVRLFDAYYRAGVEEYWVVDAIGALRSYDLHPRGGPVRAGRRGRRLPTFAAAVRVISTPRGRFAGRPS